MSLQSVFGYSTSERPMMKRLAEGGVLVVRDSYDNESLIRLSLPCDDYYCMDIDTNDLRQLAVELGGLADMLDLKANEGL